MKDNIMPKNLPIYTVTFDPQEENMGVFKVSIVKDPAIESDFVALSKENALLLADLPKTTQTDKQTVTGALLIPDKQILRVDNGEYFNLVFEKETISKLRDKFHKDNFGHNVNLDHETDIQNAYMTESWIKETENDKSVGLGFDLPIGTWFATYKIEDKVLFEKIKNTKEYNGFSVEAFIDKNIKFKKEKNMNKENKNFLAAFFKALSNFVSVGGDLPSMETDLVDQPEQTPATLPADPQEAMAVLQQDNMVLNQKYNDMMAEMELLKAKIDEITSQKDAVMAEKEAVVAEKEAVVVENEGLKAELEKEKGELSKKMEELTQKTEELTQTKEKLSKIEAEDAVQPLTKGKEKFEEVPSWKRFSEALKRIS